MHTIEKHSKLLVVGVKGKSHGFSLALASLCDVVIASENASFALSEHNNAVLNPGAGALTSRALPQNLVSCWRSLANALLSIPNCTNNYTSCNSL